MCLSRIDNLADKKMTFNFFADFFTNPAKPPESNNGYTNLIDLISNDVQRIELTTRWVFASFLFALEFTAVTVSLLYLIGWPALMGVLFLVMMLLCVLIISSICAGLRLETAELSDRRLLLMNELVTGIRALKTHAWEEYYQEKVKATRR